MAHIRYDARGHGLSPVLEGRYALAELGRDALALLDRLGVARAHVCGLPLGGMTAMWRAAHAPQRVGGLVGDAHVDRAVAATTELTAPLQDLITRFA